MVMLFCFFIIVSLGIILRILHWARNQEQNDPSYNCSPGHIHISCVPNEISFRSQFIYKFDGVQSLLGKLTIVLASTQRFYFAYW